MNFKSSLIIVIIKLIIKLLQNTNNRKITKIKPNKRLTSEN